MICPRTGDVCKCSDQEICTLDIAFINLGSPADAPVSIESSVEPSVSGMAMMVNRADEFAAMARDAERYRRIRDGDHPLPANFSSLAFDEMDAAIDAAMADRNK